MAAIGGVTERNPQGSGVPMSGTDRTLDQDFWPRLSSGTRGWMGQRLNLAHEPQGPKELRKSISALRAQATQTTVHELNRPTWVWNASYSAR